MKFSHSESGGTPIILQYQIGEAMADVGVPVVVGGSNNEGIALAATTTASDLIGITNDAEATLATAQTADNADPARTVGVVINADAGFRCKWSGGATENTALTLFDVTTASTTGLVITTGDAWDCPTYDEGTVFDFDGANVGIGRKITSVSSTAGTLLVALPNDTVVGDNFLRFPVCASPYGMEDQFVQLTTALYQADASVAVDTDNNNFRVKKLLLNDTNADGRNNCWAVLQPFDSIWAAGGSI